MYKISLKKFRTEAPEKKRKSRWKFWFFLIAFLACVGGGIYFLNLPDYKIKDIKIYGAVFTQGDDVKAIVQNEIGQNYFFAIPRSHIWFYPRSEIKQKLESLSSVVEANVEVNSANVLVIKLTERKQDYLWCQALQTESLNKNCFYMDKDGFVFAPAPVFEGNVFLTFAGMITDSAVGKNFLPKENMSLLLNFVDKIKQFGLMPASIKVVSLREVRITLRSGSTLIVSFDDNLDSVTKNIATLMQAPDFIKASGGLNAIDYIDLRYGAKAFWKPKVSGI